MALAIGNQLCHYPIKLKEADMPTRQDKHNRVLRDKAIVDGIGRGLADMKAGNTVPHDAAMAEVDTLLDGIEAATFFAERAKRADLQWFDRFMNRKGGEPPRAGDELPEGYKRRG